MADSKKSKRKMPTFREIVRIGVDAKGNDIFASKADRDRVLAHEKAEREAKKKKKKGLGRVALRDN